VGEVLEVGVEVVKREEDEEKAEMEQQQENFEVNTNLTEFDPAFQSLLSCMYQDNTGDCIRRVHNVGERKKYKQCYYNCLR